MRVRELYGNFFVFGLASNKVSSMLIMFFFVYWWWWWGGGGMRALGKNLGIPYYRKLTLHEINANR